MWLIPETESLADAEIDTWPFKTWPAVIPESAATPGGAVSTTNDEDRVPKTPALFCTDAVNVCVPSVRALAGVKDMRLVATAGVTIWPSRTSAALATLIPVKESPREIVIVGRTFPTNDPLAGEFSCRIGAVVSGEMNMLLNGAV